MQTHAAHTTTSQNTCGSPLAVKTGCMHVKRTILSVCVAARQQEQAPGKPAAAAALRQPGPHRSPRKAFGCMPPSYSATVRHTPQQHMGGRWMNAQHTPDLWPESSTAGSARRPVSAQGFFAALRCMRRSHTPHRPCWAYCLGAAEGMRCANYCRHATPCCCRAGRHSLPAPAALATVVRRCTRWELNCRARHKSQRNLTCTTPRHTHTTCSCCFPGQG